ncbi:MULTISPECIES: pseudouridine synthase [Nocardiaceae]|uniref:RNA pseudouridylate synthase n=1 Tax=Rhodococcoides kroppenstedtii TaxID=293050 RepID=A0ABS7NYE3_9NOCA|nr:MULTISPECIES: pseudouridine synthase [Rhodococcus]AMY20135.1 Ribosomal large subunit pseudouridine synthase A [Rhodococcus sp. PBTS 1]MBT1191658.1 pseudouridine synthase [Rhodococcus kroppenstedtii]MBY6315229.1 pseudouridine synthase [Rhodococcus kroppenstedtii]MBY6322971.1 pseudouridine synthase [Rhodococcus kroppenstedtii]MBY6399828.1 pseudouridine synthase [Rhodococcus kroppenstedtii]
MPAPLPVRDGLNPTRIRMPDPPASYPTVVAYLKARFPDDADALAAKIDAGEVVDARGTPITATTPLVPRADVWLHRDPPAEPEVPFALPVLHADRDLVVVDKPHFLATTPRGRFVVQSAVVRLRRELGNDELSPAHRLDRLTAGVLVFTARPDVRRAYQEMFAARAVTKVYEAVAPVGDVPSLMRSRIVKTRESLQAREVPGEVNAETRVEIIDTAGDLALYRLRPTTGKTHQLRVHLASAGIPIVGDSLYPVPREVAVDDYRDPLRLLARSIAFDDPITGAPRRFESARTLPPFGPPTDGRSPRG